MEMSVNRPGTVSFQRSDLGFHCSKLLKHRCQNAQSLTLAMNLRKTIRCVGRFATDEEATTAVEYAVMLALIIAVCIASVSFLTIQTKESFDNSGEAIVGALGN